MKSLSSYACAACVCLSLLLSTAICAASVDEPSIDELSVDEPRGALTLSQAIAAALARNPDLIASQYEVAIAEARITQSALRINPEISVDLDNFAGSGAAQGTHALETTLRLSQVVELGRKRSLRSDVATANRDLIGIEQQARQLDVLSEVTRRFILLIAAQEHSQLSRDSMDLAQRTLTAITLRVQAARSPEVERSRASIALTLAQIETQQAENDERAARVALSALWGSYRPRFTVASGDLFKVSSSPSSVSSFDELITKLERNPDFVSFASQTRLHDAELQLEQARARPNLTFGMGVRRLQETNDTALVASFSMPLPISDRNQGAIREARIRRDQANAQQSAAFTRARAVLYGLYQALDATRARLDALRNAALPQAQQALDQTQYGYERGRFSYLELVTAQQELIQLRAAVINAATDYHRFAAEIERLTSEPLAIAN